MSNVFKSWPHSAPWFFFQLVVRSRGLLLMVSRFGNVHNFTAMCHSLNSPGNTAQENSRHGLDDLNLPPSERVLVTRARWGVSQHPYEEKKLHLNSPLTHIAKGNMPLYCTWVKVRHPSHPTIVNRGSSKGKKALERPAKKMCNFVCQKVIRPCSWPRPVKFWISPRMDTPQALWATCCWAWPSPS